MGSAFCCAWRVSYVEVCCNVVAILSMADMAVCRNCIAWAMLGLYGMLELKLCCEILLLLNMADMGCLLCVTL